MKKTTIIITAFFCLLFVVGCEKSNNEDTSPVSVLTYTPYFTTENSSLCGGEIDCSVDAGVTDFGICWAEFPRPTIEDESYSGWNDFTSVDNVKWFTYTINGLKPNTTYYVRAYVTCGQDKTYYAEVKSFYTSIAEEDAYYRTYTVNGYTFRMVKVDTERPFHIGAQNTNPLGENYDPEANPVDQPIHEVVLRKNYYIGETEVSLDLWYSITGYNPGYYWGEDTPANGTTWNMIVYDFLPKLNELTGKNFRLPTESEWEFAARGENQGRHYRFAGSNDFNDVGWCLENSGDVAHPMAQKAPNERGLYDMAGNVSEWCQDWINLYSEETQIDPVGVMFENYPQRVMRGGNYHFEAKCATNSCRHSEDPDGRYINIGFRLVCDP